MREIPGFSVETLISRWLPAVRRRSWRRLETNDREAGFDRQDPVDEDPAMRTLCQDIGGRRGGSGFCDPPAFGRPARTGASATRSRRRRDRDCCAERFSARFYRPARGDRMRARDSRDRKDSTIGAGAARGYAHSDSRWGGDRAFLQLPDAGNRRRSTCSSCSIWPSAPRHEAEEAIVATTWNPACSLRLSHVVSSLEPGK